MYICLMLFEFNRNTLLAMFMSIFPLRFRYIGKRKVASPGGCCECVSLRKHRGPSMLHLQSTDLFFFLAPPMAVQYLALLAPSPFRSIGGRLVTYRSRRIKIHRGSDDSGVKIHRNATTAGACIFTRVSRAANERFDVPARVGGPSR